MKSEVKTKPQSQPASVVPPQGVATTTNPQEVRRRVPRRVIRQRIGLLAGGKYSADAFALELGEGGMLISTSLKLQKGQKVVITVRIRGVLQGVMLALVVYPLSAQKNESDSRYGVQFENIDFDVKRKIRNFVASGAGETAVGA